MNKSDNVWKNQLFFADNLEVLKRYCTEYPKGFIDLIYNDPPFNSKRNYSVLFETIDMTDTKAQKQAFADTWSNISYYETLNELQDLTPDVYNYLKCLDSLAIPKGSVSYLTIMAIRIYYMHKLLKDTGSFYLHCDPTMSHYLKIVCDLIFGVTNFRNEIVWCYSRMAAKGQRQYSRCHDIILWYSKSSNWIFKVDEVRLPYSESSKARVGYKKTNLGGGSPKSEICELNEFGKFPEDWINIPFIRGQEYLGYPTQKPELLLERIISASSNKGDLVADFFCGCGTSIAVAQKLKRHWIGIDISHLAVRLITKRLVDAYGSDITKTYEIHGFPKDIDSAKELANNVTGGRLQFEQWIVEVMLNGILNEKKNKLGYDGYFTFNTNNEKHYGFIEVKSGHTNVHDVNHFIATVNDKKAHFGIFVCFSEQITRAILETSKKQGKYGSFNYDKIQILSVEDLMNGKLPQIPESTKTTFKKSAPSTDGHVQLDLNIE